MTVQDEERAGLPSRIEAKRSMLAQRSRAVSPLLRMLVPDALRLTLERAAAYATDAPSTLEAMTAETEGVLDELLAAHDALDRLRECPETVPEPQLPDSGAPWSDETASQLEFRAAFTSRIAAVAPGSDVVRWNDTAYIVRTQIDGVPLIVTATFLASTSGLHRFQSRLRTSVPAATPPLDVRRARAVVDPVGRAVGVAGRRSVGDRSFDDAFIVDGGKPAALLLGPDVREALVELDRFAPRLHVYERIVELTWEGPAGRDPADLVPPEACAVVRGVRAAFAVTSQ